MFREVPECSGMFRDVPCFGFYRSPAPGDTVLLYLLNQGSVDESCLSLFPTIFKISREHILPLVFSFVFSIGPAAFENP